MQCESILALTQYVCLESKQVDVVEPRKWLNVSVYRVDCVTPRQQRDSHDLVPLHQSCHLCNMRLSCSTRSSAGGSRRLEGECRQRAIYYSAQGGLLLGACRCRSGCSRGGTCWRCWREPRSCRCAPAAQTRTHGSSWQVTQTRCTRPTAPPLSPASKRTGRPDAQPGRLMLLCLHFPDKQAQHVLASCAVATAHQWEHLVAAQLCSGGGGRGAHDMEVRLDGPAADLYNGKRR